MAIGEFEQTIEQSTGQTVDHARQTLLSDLRAESEASKGKVTVFVSAYPDAGRGCVMRDRLVSHAEVEAACDDAIRRLGE
jgi:hypothetical protein